MERVQDLRVLCVDDTLQLIYYTQSELTVSSDGLVPLGTKEFAMDDKSFDTYLTNVLKLWHGERAARGVMVEQSYQCQ
jgi:Exonuclease V - a 5' deoxyribonuclease